MSFENSAMRFYNGMRGAISQFRFNTDRAIHMTVSGPSRYTYLDLDMEQTQAVNVLAMQVGKEHEQRERMRFMSYSATLLPFQAKAADGFCAATAEQNRIFGQIFEMAAASIAKQMGWAVKVEDVKRIAVETTVDFSFIEAQRAHRLTIELSESAAGRLYMDHDERCREFGKGPQNGVAVIIYPGQN